MSKYNSVSSIRTLWENNPDTPLTAANLSRLQDLTASYLNTDGLTDLHVEGSILFRNPENTSEVVIKRGTVFQIINEVSDAGIPVIPTNAQYKVFDVGLEDIVLTWADTDTSQSSKITWGSGENQWYVFVCDKDDSVLHTKLTADDYGGGADILISKYNDYPRETVSGRTTDEYSVGDTRLIGGFKTNGDTITENTVWDIANKAQTAKAKAYYILDEYAIGGAEYRQIQLSDLNTYTDNQFDKNVSIVGDLDVALNMSVADITSGSITSTGTLGQTGPSFFDGTFGVDGIATFYENVFINKQSFFMDDVEMDAILNIQNTAYESKFKVSPDTARLDASLDFYNTGLFDLQGNFAQTGNITQVGNVVLGGNGKDITLAGDLGINNNIFIDKSDSTIIIKSPANIDELVVIDQDDATMLTKLSGGVIFDNNVTVTGSFNINAGGDVINLFSTSEIASSAPIFKHTGSMIIDGGDEEFLIQSADDNPIFSVETASNQITTNANVDVLLGLSETFTVKDEDTQSVILGVEYNTLTEKRVVINNVLTISETSADNALNVTGNADISGDLTVGGILTADVQGELAGGAASWTNDLSLHFIGDATGLATFDGSEGSIDVTMQVQNDSHEHTNYYTETELQTSGQAVVDFGNVHNFPAGDFATVGHTHSITDTHHYLQYSDIDWDLLANSTLVSATGGNNGDNGDSELIARSNHKHDTVYVKLNTMTATDVEFIDTLSGDNSWNTVANALNGMYQYNEDIYQPKGGTGSFDSIEVDNLTVIENINTRNIFVDDTIDISSGSVNGDGRLTGLLFQGSTLNDQVYMQDGQLKVARRSIGGTQSGFTRGILYSEDNSNVAVSTWRLEQAQPFSLNGSTSASVTQGGTQDFDGQDGLNFGQVVVNFAGSGVQDTSARSDHNHTGIYATSGHNHTGVYEDAFAKNGAFNKDFGTTSGTVSEGNHTHDTRYYTETEVNTRSNELVQNMVNLLKTLTGSHQTMINPFTDDSITSNN